MSKLIIFFIFIAFIPAKLLASETSTGTETATFAGGCFWCMEPPFDKLDGVISTTVGYTAGHKTNPTYQEVSSGGTGHAEAIQVVFNPEKISCSELLETYWRNIDPLALNRQFCDIGTQYHSGIYYHDAAQERAAKQSLDKLEKSKPFEGTIVTEILPASTFYPAEDYHQIINRKTRYATNITVSVVAAISDCKNSGVKNNPPKKSRLPNFMDNLLLFR
jgi:peptide-methionine (S)-S-oxide reductase